MVTQTSFKVMMSYIEDQKSSLMRLNKHLIAAAKSNNYEKIQSAFEWFCLEGKGRGDEEGSRLDGRENI